MTRRVVFSPHAQQDLSELSLWIAQESGFPSHAADFVFAILDFCDGLADSPFLGRSRDDLRPGLRTIGFRRRVVVAFAVDADSVQVLGVYCGGRDYERLLAPH
ncbi:hypothetical protein GCM10022240_31770 [Microbacterium kribbense]|uniref:Type II toxin-antitoxin system RelE/ParE family toxin n=1 Tax=Microbacterium kribbense TaxID=433645 RepID=A0ABP7H2V9_9MICO